MLESLNHSSNIMFQSTHSVVLHRDHGTSWIICDCFDCNSINSIRYLEVVDLRRSCADQDGVCLSHTKNVKQPDTHNSDTEQQQQTLALQPECSHTNFVSTTVTQELLPSYTHTHTYIYIYIRYIHTVQIMHDGYNH